MNFVDLEDMADIAFHDGYNDFMDGIDICPYHMSHFCKKHWEAGWWNAFYDCQDDF